MVQAFLSGNCMTWESVTSGPAVGNTGSSMDSGDEQKAFRPLIDEFVHVACITSRVIEKKL